MKKAPYSKPIHLLLFLLIFCSEANAQWTEIGSFNSYVNDLKTFSGHLWIGGYFNKANDYPSYFSAVYDGSSYTYHPGFLGASIGIRDLEVFNDQLFEVGGISFTQIGSWNGSSWTTEGDYGIGYSCLGIYADGDDLYVGSNSGEAFKRTGAGPFTPLTAFGQNDKLYAFARFNDQIIVGGYISNATYHNIAAWTGTYWMPLGSGLNGTVNSLAVYNDDLYVAGTFNLAGGQSIVGIAKWDGTAWSDVGGSVSGSAGNAVWDLEVIDNRLYVAGDFSRIGGVNTRNVAFWDGNHWTGLNFTESSNFPNCIESYNGHLYIATLSLTSACKLYRFDGNVATQSPYPSLQFTCSPNPAADQLRIALTIRDQDTANLTLRISDAAGRLILEDRHFFTEAVCNCVAWPAGKYQVTLSDGSGNLLGSQQIIRE